MSTAFERSYMYNTLKTIFFKVYHLFFYEFMVKYEYGKKETHKKEKTIQFSNAIRIQHEYACFLDFAEPFWFFNDLVSKHDKWNIER